MDRSGRVAPDVTHHPLSESSSNSARFRCKGGQSVTHQPGLRRCSLIGIAPVAPPTQDAVFVDTRLLAQAPELAALALLDVALELSARALLAEHPTLGLNESESEPVLLRRAQRLLNIVGPLQRAVRRYRAAVISVTGTSKKVDDDLPF